MSTSILTINGRVAELVALDSKASADLNWIYRLAQNPRWIWLAFVPPFLLIAARSVTEFLLEPSRATISYLAIGITIVGVASLFPSVGGFTHLRSPGPPESPSQPIPTEKLWTLHLPLLVVTISAGSFALLEYLEPHMTLGSGFTPGRNFAAAVLLFGVALLSFLVLGHRRRLRFTPERLEYTRGRFQASIPWAEIVDLRPVCDENGGRGTPERPSRHNLRAGVQQFVRDGVDVHGKTMLFRDDGQDVIGVDCSGYRIDPNTLINAIYLLAENPDLRPLLATPAVHNVTVWVDETLRREGFQLTIVISTARITPAVDPAVVLDRLDGHPLTASTISTAWIESDATLLHQLVITTFEDQLPVHGDALRNLT